LRTSSFFSFSYSFRHVPLSLQVDVLGTMALLASNSSKPGVSVELNTSYLAAAEVGSRLRIEGTALRIGKRLGFTEVKLSDERTGRLIAVGRHTKAFPGE
jgi:acyl-coenzyme A thioesterase 13